jgi:hypothetical protein
MGPLHAPFYALQIFLAQLLHRSSSLGVRSANEYATEHVLMDFTGFTDLLKSRHAGDLLYPKPDGGPVKADVQWRKRG